MVLLGHLHTHEFAAGGTTDQVGNPVGPLPLSPGGSSGGSARRARGPDDARRDGDRHGRVAAHSLGDLRHLGVKPTRGTRPDPRDRPARPHLRPRRADGARRRRLRAAARGDGRHESRGATRGRCGASRVSPRLGLVELDPDVAEASTRRRRLPRLASSSSTYRPRTSQLDLGLTFLDLVPSRCSSTTAASTTGASCYRPSLRGFLEYGEAARMTAEDYVSRAGAARRRRPPAGSTGSPSSASTRSLEPTLPIVAHPRGHGYDEAFTDFAEISLTHYWNWAGLPVATLPSGVGAPQRPADRASR